MPVFVTARLTASDNRSQPWAEAYYLAPEAVAAKAAFVMDLMEARLLVAATLLKRIEPKSNAKFVEFTTLLDPRQMPGQRSNVLRSGRR